MKDHARLIIAASEGCPDLLYATGFSAPDPFIFVESGGRRFIVLNDLEIDRGRRQAKADKVIAWSDLIKRLPSPGNPTLAQVAVRLLKDLKVRSALVPETFPLGLAMELAAARIRLTPVTGLFWKEREFKSAGELRMVGRALRITEAGMARGMEVLRASDIGRGNRLRWGNAPLTSEILRAEIESAILRAGGQPTHTIVAGGDQACDPHERGHGPLRAGTPIILDVFPRDATTGYFGDMTRTVVRGRASTAQRRLWETVLEGQKRAMKATKPGGVGAKIHDQVKQFFADSGYPTEKRKGRWTGFFHGTGHGLGLEIHEEPRFAKATFTEGQVLTVEPGLYYPGLGGVRIEDVVTVTRTGIRVLSRFPKTLEV